MESGGAGVILGSLIQVLIPRDWLLRTLGNRAFAARCWERFFAAGYDVYLLCGSGRGGNASPTGVDGRCAGILDGESVVKPATLCLWGSSGWGFAAIRLVAAGDGVADCDAGAKMGA
ncbi:hypothetical protein EH63_10420 [Escherichia coli]|nr:hypothetical protein EH63_10420 [Escherichia coli]